MKNVTTILAHSLRVLLIGSTLGVLPTAAFANSSEQNRENKWLGATLGVSGLSVGLYATKNTVLEGTYSYRRDHSVWTNNVKSRIRHFVGNSFYGSLGFDYERRNTPPHELVLSGEEVEPSSLPDRVFLGTMAMGNQWQWRALTIGVDWLEVRVPIGRVVSAQLDSPEKSPVHPRPTPKGLGPLDINVMNVYAGITI